jgi:hypothetical protein
LRAGAVVPKRLPDGSHVNPFDMEPLLPVGRTVPAMVAKESNLAPLLFVTVVAPDPYANWTFFVVSVWLTAVALPCA